MGDFKYYGDLFFDDDECSTAVNFKYRNKRLLKIWAIIMLSEIIILGTFLSFAYKFVFLSYVWC